MTSLCLENLLSKINVKAHISNDIYFTTQLNIIQDYHWLYSSHKKMFHLGLTVDLRNGISMGNVKQRRCRSPKKHHNCHDIRNTSALEFKLSTHFVRTLFFFCFFVFFSSFYYSSITACLAVIKSL